MIGGQAPRHGIDRGPPGAADAAIQADQDLTGARNLAPNRGDQLDPPLPQELRHSRTGAFTEDLQRRPLGREKGDLELEALRSGPRCAHQRHLVQGQRPRQSLGHNKRQPADVPALDPVDQITELVAVAAFDRDDVLVARTSQRPEAEHERVIVKLPAGRHVRRSRRPVNPGEAVLKERVACSRPFRRWAATGRRSRSPPIRSSPHGSRPTSRISGRSRRRPDSVSPRP